MPFRFRAYCLFCNWLPVALTACDAASFPFPSQRLNWAPCLVVASPRVFSIVHLVFSIVHPFGVVHLWGGISRYVSACIALPFHRASVPNISAVQQTSLVNPRMLGLTPPQFDPRLLQSICPPPTGFCEGRWGFTPAPRFLRPPPRFTPTPSWWDLVPYPTGTFF